MAGAPLFAVVKWLVGQDIAGGAVYPGAVPTTVTRIPASGIVAARLLGGQPRPGTTCDRYIIVEVGAYGPPVGGQPVSEVAEKIDQAVYKVFTERATPIESDGVLVYSATLTSGPVAGVDPETDWPFVRSSYLLHISTE